MRFNSTLLIVFLLLFFTVPVRAANLDQLYGPLVKPRHWLYTGRLHHYSNWERGHHGSASFDSFDAHPRVTSLLNALRFSPAINWDVQFGFQNIFPAGYRRTTKNNSDNITSSQKYFINNGQDLTLNLRRRLSSAEIYFDMLAKSSKSQWNFAVSDTAAPMFFNSFNSHYEDIKLGIRTLSKGTGNSSLFSRPLLDAEQLNTQWELGYKNGRLDRKGIFYVADIQRRHYLNRTKPHFLPSVQLRYGLSPKVEVEGGLSYISPIKYLFDFKQYKDSGLSSFISGTYVQKNHIEIPLKIRFRPIKNVEYIGTLDYRYLSQRFYAWEQAENGTVTLHPQKKLNYYNIVPQLEFNYVTTPDHEKTPSIMDTLTKKLLAKRQKGFTFKFIKDWTIFKKNASNGSQNVVDPYNVYLYSTENFFAGTEYAAFFSGNNASTPSNLQPQNYFELAGGMRYGLSDQWEIGFSTGYRSATTGHQYSIGDTSNRFLKFKEYYYINLMTDWDMRQDARLSFMLHLVPDYKTVLDASNSPEQFKDHSRYIETSVVFQKLF